MKIIREAAAAELMALLILWRNAPLKPIPGTELQPGQHGPLRQVADRYQSKAQVLRRIVKFKNENGIAGMVQIDALSPQWHKLVNNPETRNVAKAVAGFLRDGRVYV